jgi:hypothetical protein
LVCAGFCFAGVFLIPRNPVVAWLGLAFFGLGAILSLIVVLFPQISSLRLAPEGFYLRSIVRTQFISWGDVSLFGVASISMNEMVVFNYAATYTGQRLGRSLAFDLVGWEGALSDTFGMSAEELANLMNAWKRRSEVVRQPV